MKEIYICKLIDGSFVVGKFNKDEQLIDGVEMMLVPGQMGQMGIAMVPIMYPFNKNVKNDIIIDKSKILHILEADDDIISKYIEASIGIVSPKSVFTN